MIAGRVRVYLWEAGTACGVSDDPETAVRHAEQYLCAGLEARVERAVSLPGEGWERTYLRTGDIRVGRLTDGGLVRWQRVDGIAGPEPKASRTGALSVQLQAGRAFLQSARRTMA